MNRWVLYSSVGMLALTGAGCVDRAAQQQSKATEKIVTDQTHVVSAQPAAMTTLVDSVEITGDVETTLDTQVGPKVGGRLTSVTVKDGDPVTAGQVLATVDNTAQLAQAQQAYSALQQAAAGLQSAQSQLAQATSNAALSPSKSTAAVRQAQAALRSARAQLEKAVNGARPQERVQAQSAAQSAKVNLDNAQKELARIAKLVGEGAIAANRLDQQQTAVAAAQAQYEQAQQAYNLIQVGTRSEDIATARAAVQQAEEGLRSAQAQKSLDVLLVDQVNAARAGVESSKAQMQSAKAQVSIAQQNLADTIVKAPFSGRVQGKPMQVGSVVGAGTSIVHIIGGQGVYFSGQVPENGVARMQAGKRVDVTLDSLPGVHFNGVVMAVSPEGSSVGRQFDVRVAISGNLSEVKPGMFARGKVQLAVYPGATVVPTTAVVSQGDAKYVFVVDGNKARQVPVRTGLTRGQLVQVSGLPDGAQVIVRGQTGLADGSPIRVQSATAAALASGEAQG